MSQDDKLNFRKTSNESNSSDNDITVMVHLGSGSLDNDQSQQRLIKSKYIENDNITIGEKIRRFFNKGNNSNIFTFLIMITGVLLRTFLGHGSVVARYILSFGLFGFAGGITNWLAIKMLFDKIPLLYGSGVIPQQFKEIRQTIKDVILDTFFDPKFLDKYVSQKAGQFTSSLNLEEKIKQMLESPIVDQIIDEKLIELGTRPEGMFLAMMGITPASLKPMIKPFVLGMGADIGPMLLNNFDISKIFNISKLRGEIDALMTTKLQELTPEIVKKLMEQVIRTHLGWLIVWGNIFGSFIGILSTVAGFG